MEISVAEIRIPENLMRQGMSEKGLENLARSMKEIGLMHPIGISAREDENVLIYGARRLAVAKMLEWDVIEATVYEGFSATEEIMRVMENREREDVNPIDEGTYYKKLLVDRGWTQALLADMLQVSAGYVSQRIGSLEWPKSLKEAVEVGALSFSTAREIAGIKDYEHMLYIITHAAKNGATPTVAREWKRRANLDFEEARRRNAEGDFQAEPVMVHEAQVHCHTCGKKGPVSESGSFTTCPECRALIEAVKEQGHFKEHKEKEEAIE